MTDAYKEFLESREWSALRHECFRRYGDACPCGSFERVQVHHLFYPKDIRETKVEHLIPLCEAHHQAVHRSRTKPFVYREEFVDAIRDVLTKRILTLFGDSFFDLPSSRALIADLERRRKEFAERPRVYTPRREPIAPDPVKVARRSAEKKIRDDAKTRARLVSKAVHRCALTFEMARFLSDEDLKERLRSRPTTSGARL